MTSNRPAVRVSCIIPVYNGERYLRESINSLLAQDHPDVELVVVDDGSTDGTADIIASYGKQLNALRQDNRGVSVARNVGVEASAGELLCFLDADDLLRSQKISMQVAAFAADATLDLCDCHMQYFWSPELSEQQLRQDPRYAAPFWHKTMSAHISTWLLTRELWERVGPFKPGMRYSEDVDWFSRGKDVGMRRQTLPDVLTDRRLHVNNVTASNHVAQGESLAEALMAHLLRKRKDAST